MITPAARKWILIVATTLVVLACVLVLPVTPVCRDSAYICEYTGSRKGAREWLFGLKTGSWYKESPLETFIKQKYPNELEHQWTSYAGTGRNIFGGGLGRAHGSPGPIAQLPIDLLIEYSAVASPAEIKHVYDTMRRGSGTERKTMPEKIFEAVLQRKEKTEPDVPTNRSQPIRPETSQTSSVAGSGR